MDDLKQRLRAAHENSPQRIAGSHIFDEAAAALDALEAENARLRDQLRLIELLGYREGEQMGWLVAHMRGVANDALEGRTSAHMWRLFPRHRPAALTDQ